MSKEREIMKRSARMRRPEGKEEAIIKKVKWSGSDFVTDRKQKSTGERREAGAF